MIHVGERGQHYYSGSVAIHFVIQVMRMVIRASKVLLEIVIDGLIFAVKFD